jgi:hypothetical protein
MRADLHRAIRDWSDHFDSVHDGLSRERAMREAREIAKTYSAAADFISAAVLEVEVKAEVEV